MADLPLVKLVFYTWTRLVIWRNIYSIHRFCLVHWYFLFYFFSYPYHHNHFSYFYAAIIVATDIVIFSCYYHGYYDQPKICPLFRLYMPLYALRWLTWNPVINWQLKKYSVQWIICAVIEIIGLCLNLHSEKKQCWYFVPVACGLGSRRLSVWK